MDPAQSAEQTRPWYRHPWVWFLIAIPGASVLVGVLMLTLAINGPTGLVRDDYYKAGLAINQQLEGARRAEALGVQARLRERSAGDWLLEVIIDRPGDLGVDLDASLQHPTLEERDREFALIQVAHDRWATTLPPLEGRRMLEVSPPDGSWTLRQELRFESGAPGAPSS